MYNQKLVEIQLGKDDGSEEYRKAAAFVDWLNYIDDSLKIIKSFDYNRKKPVIRENKTTQTELNFFANTCTK